MGRPGWLPFAEQMNPTHPFLDLDGDKLREECGTLVRRQVPMG